VLAGRASPLTESRPAAFCYSLSSLYSPYFFVYDAEA